MAYSAIADMARSNTLVNRITGAAAQEGIPDPQAWAMAHVWQIAAQPGWADAWAYAVDTANDDVNPDTGARPGVIGDAMILAAVQAIRAMP